MLAICLPNIPEYPIAFLGSVEAGLTITTVNPMYTAGKKNFLISGRSEKGKDSSRIEVYPSERKNEGILSLGKWLI